MVGTSNWGSWNDAIDVADVGAWPSGNSTVCELEYGPFMDDLLSEEFKMFIYQRVNILFCGSAVTYSITPNPLWWTWWMFSPMNPGLGYGMTPRRSAKLDAAKLAEASLENSILSDLAEMLMGCVFGWAGFRRGWKQVENPQTHPHYEMS